jgi:hypothetical protein
MSKPEVMTINDLQPDPRPIIEQMANEVEESSLIFGYAHGSMLYRPQGSLVGGYQEVRVFDPKTEQVVRVDYEPKAQPPDIDLIAVVEDQEQFSSYFRRLAVAHKLGKGINYFFTLNASEEAAHEREITSADPRAYKRVLAYRPTQGFGDMDQYERAKQVASEHVGPLDQAFQKELLGRKAMMTGAVENGHEPFSLTAEEFVTRFPLFYVNLHTYYGDFEEGRDKFVLPHSMDIKGKQYLGSDHIEPIR